MNAMPQLLWIVQKILARNYFTYGSHFLKMYFSTILGVVDCTFSGTVNLGIK